MHRGEERTAVVVGAGTILGRAIVNALCANQITVCGLDRDKQELANLERVALQQQMSFRPILCDYLDACAVENAVRRVIDEFKRVDVAVNAVMQHGFSPVERVSDETWNTEILANLSSTFYLIRAVAGHMKQRRAGRIVTISSTAKDGVPWFAHMGHAAHAAARGGIAGLTRALAYEMGRYDVTVNCVVPGPVKEHGQTSPFDALMDDPDVDVYPTSFFAIRRFGEPMDVAHAVAYLASEEAAYVTGQFLYVSGGLYA